MLSIAATEMGPAPLQRGGRWQASRGPCLPAPLRGLGHTGTTALLTGTGDLAEPRGLAHLPSWLRLIPRLSSCELLAAGVRLTRLTVGVQPGEGIPEPGLVQGQRFGPGHSLEPCTLMVPHGDTDRRAGRSSMGVLGSRWVMRLRKGLGVSREEHFENSLYGC